jgi:hypothetical protein
MHGFYGMSYYMMRWGYSIHVGRLVTSLTPSPTPQRDYARSNFQRSVGYPLTGYSSYGGRTHLNHEAESVTTHSIFRVEKVHACGVSEQTSLRLDFTITELRFLHPLP